jgi:uncharacterized OB-fold protein
MTNQSAGYVGVREDLFSQPLYPLENVTLMGTRCLQCGEVFFGKVPACENCQSETLESIALNRNGTLYSYTINWNKPGGDYKGPDPFKPFAVGLVELPEGIRIVSEITEVDFNRLKIGMRLELSTREFYTEADGKKVITYVFKPEEKP